MDSTRTPTATSGDQTYRDVLARRNTHYDLNGMAALSTAPLVADRLRNLLGQGRRFTVVRTLGGKVTDVHTSCYLHDVRLSADQRHLTVRYHTAWDGDGVVDTLGWTSEYETEAPARRDWEQAKDTFGSPRSVYRFAVAGGLTPDAFGRASEFRLQWRNEYGVEFSVTVRPECPPEEARA